uniref:MAM domain-containing protein n=1 Tax=Panagrolaimus davidi TaxID=227884 RepID=A0A914PM29_9BILA
MQTSYKIVLRARSIHSAEDIIGVDDLQLMDALETEQVIAQQQQSSKRYPSLMAASQRHFSPIEEPSTEFPLIDSERQKAEPPIETKHVENPLMPLKMNKFGMSPSLSSAIMPTKPETLFPPLPNFTAPVPAAFPDFPSFPQGFLPGTLPATNNKLEKQEMTLGPTWKRSDGNIAMETGGEDTVISAAFKAPLGSYIEFDLWMSDDSFFTVMEVMDSMDFILFTRQGMSNNGWHRFRIPLRPSFTPVQIKFKNALPPGGFITLSNTRLVNGNGEEVSCETVYGGIVTMPPLFPPPSSMSLQNLMAPAPPIQMPSMLKLRDNIGGGASAFGGNIFEGVKPIKPMKDDPQRLTAFQGYTPQMLLSTTPEPFLLPTFQKSEFPIIDATTKNHALSGFGLPFSQFQQPKPVGIVSATSNSKGGGGDLLSQLGAHPSVEKELRQLASRFGFDTNKIPDPTTLNMLKRFLGPKMPLNFGTKIAEFNSNGNNNGISQNLRPIKPVNVDSEDFERVYKEESLKRMFAPPTSAELSKASSSLNGELLKSFASVIQLPSNSPDPQLPFRQKNLDFAYQNALSSPSKKY